jgi:membrane dipeptidase
MRSQTSSFPNDLLIFDAHCDTVHDLVDPSIDFRKRTQGHLDLKRCQKGGLKAQIFALYVNPVYAPHRSLKKALMLYQTLEKKIFSPGYGMKVTSTAEMDQAIRKNKLACWLALEGGHIIENSIDILELFHSLGIRCLTLTHSKNTDWADSSGDSPRWDGLNALGKKIVTHMQELHMVIDVSHVSDKTVESVLDVTSAPIMASHSNARALCDIPRNLPDSLIKEIAKRNGYIGVNFFPVFLKKTIYDQASRNVQKYKQQHQELLRQKPDDPDFISKAESDLFQKYVIGNDHVDVNTLIDHIDHIANVGGVECVGLGSDFDGINSTPTNLPDVSSYPALIEGLSLRGYTTKEIQKIMGLNLYHFLKRFDP